MICLKIVDSRTFPLEKAYATIRGFSRIFALAKNTLLDQLLL